VKEENPTMTARDSQRESQPLPKASDWLSPFVSVLRAQGDRLLEAGCGPGLDAATLHTHGFHVVGFDRAPLERARVNAPRAMLLRADLRQRLPFRDGAFDCAVSSLALHYLPWAETRAVFGEIRRVPGEGSAFLFRVNATDDFAHGAGQGEELEPNFYRVADSYQAHFSETKRFFDEAMVRAALDELFTLEQLEHKTIHRYEEPKRVWECLGRAI
jgi:SAM-dependent methyltransferase